jgi:hypothetical protein
MSLSGELPVHVKYSADLELVTDLPHVVQEGRHLAVHQTIDGQLDLASV